MKSPTITIGEILSALPKSVADAVIEAAENGGEIQSIHDRMNELVFPYSKELLAIGLPPEYTAWVLTLGALTARAATLDDVAACAAPANPSLN